MGNQYFETIVTKGKIPNLETTAASHKQKLNNYLKYGVAFDDSRISGLQPNMKPVALGGQVAPVNREVHHMNTVSTMEDNGQTYGITTILCCEDETLAEEKKEGGY